MSSCPQCLLPREENCDRKDCCVKQKVLDHGYVKFIESWGSDEVIIESARMSTGRGFEGWAKDAKLLKFLWENRHHTPFEMAGLVIETAAPIFVFREWHRHRVPFSYNEMSARYIPLPDENYIPDFVNLVQRAMAATSNKQAQGTATGEIKQSSLRRWQEEIELHYARAQQLYETALSDGVPKELARIVLPVGRYSRMRASSNLRGWLHFLNLRQAPNAQWEIRQYANAVARLIELRFPKTYQLFKGEANGGAAQAG